jgi:hypothetical protein
MNGQIIIDQKGNLIAQGTIRAKHIQTDSLTVENGVTLKDQASQEYYCVTIKNGEMEKSPGKCEQAEQPEQPAPSATPTP